MRVSEQIDVTRPAADAFRYAAEFEHTAEWDPGIAESRRLTDGPVRVGTQFDVVALFRGKRQRFLYTVTELDDGRRIVLAGDGEKATSVDEITVEPKGDGSRISYTAEIKVKGIARLAEPLLKPMLAKTAKEALDGLEQKLNSPA
ncbi:MAG: SRPBCC family protein [Gaiellaceae bacterium]